MPRFANELNHTIGVTMNNKEFINELSQQVDMPVGTTGKLINETLSILENHFQQENIISITGFGTFEVKKKMERISVNPTNGKRFLIPPKLALSFKQSSILKDKFNEE